MGIGIRVIVIIVVAFLAHCDEISFAWDPSDDLEDWYDEGRAEAVSDTLEIRDPFFAFMIGIVEDDSLGVWSRDVIMARIAATGRPSQLPVERIVRVSRMEEPGAVAVGTLDRPASRLLRLELDADLALPLPYSILGYHPGTLHVSRVIEVAEWTLWATTIRMPEEDDRARAWADRIHALGIREGHVVLDVDGWVDRLLGKKLDDTWMEGFILARIDGLPDEEDNGLNGLVVGRSRKMRPLSGAFDFRRDKVLPNGRPVALALARYCRRWIAPLDQPSPDVWSYDP